MDNDGVPDFVAGALYYDAPGINNAGRARVYSGTTGTVLHEFVGTSANEEFGLDVALVGDIDHDNHADVLVGGWRDDANGLDSGSAILYSGLDGSILRSFHGSLPGDHLGISVSSAGDVDLDGTPDVILGAVQWNASGTPGPTGPGYAVVYSGATGAVLHTFLGTTPGDYFGSDVARAGDVDNDGFPDLIVTAVLDDTTTPNSGSVTVFSGLDGSILHFLPGSDGDLLGDGIAPAGDFNGDNHDDFLVGAPRDDVPGTDSGKVFLYSGLDGSVLRTFVGPHAVTGAAVMGASVDSLGDVDGDGVTDFLFGATNVGIHGSACGAAYVFSGSTAQILFQSTGDSSGDMMGWAVAAAGDVDLDGTQDFVVGAPFDDHPPVGDAGTVYLFSGACRPPVNYCTPKDNSLGCTPGITYSGNWSLSGPDDFKVLGTNILNRKLGILFWSFGTDNRPNHLGGYQCLGTVKVRTPAQNSGGSPFPIRDCSGTFSFSFTHNYLLSRSAVAGSTVYAQYYYRDPQHGDGTGYGLTAGLSFTVCP